MNALLTILLAIATQAVAGSPHTAVIATVGGASVTVAQLQAIIGILQGGSGSVTLATVIAVWLIMSTAHGCTGAATFSIDGRILGGLPAQPTTYPAMPPDHKDGAQAVPGQPPRLVWAAP